MNIVYEKPHVEAGGDRRWKEPGALNSELRILT
jgi:hypothetical protein